MRLRNRRAMSVLLAASMVFSMNTAAFAEEIPAEAVEEVAVEAAEGAEAVEAEETAGAEESAEAEEVAGAEEETAGAEVQDKDASIMATSTVNMGNGTWKSIDDKGEDKWLTTITYESNGDKKNPQDNIVKMENVTDPVSWNGSYGDVLMTTALYGSKESDGHIANGSAVTVSNGSALIGYDSYPEGVCYEAVSVNLIEVDKTNGYYIFMGYNLSDEVFNENYYVEGETDPMPITTYDGRAVDYNKSGLHKMTTSKKEVLDVDATLVKYTASDSEKGTLEEIPGLEIASVKVDKKNKVNTVASVSGEYIPITEKDDGGNLTETGKYVYNKLNGATLPSFTFQVKVKNKTLDKTVQKTIKDVSKKLKDVPFPFAIRQKVINVSDPFTIADYYWDTPEGQAEINDLVNGNGQVSDNRAKFKELGTDYESEEFGGIKFSKVSVKGSKAKATLALEVYVGDGKWADKVISPKNEYELTVVGSGDNAYAVLDFVDGGNFQYATMLSGNTSASTRYGNAKYYKNLAHLGFKWAFRQSPTNKKAFRIGFYKDATNMFVD